MTHFAIHRQKVYTLPDIMKGKRRPWGVEQAIERLNKFFYGKIHWNIPSEAQISKIFMLYHTGPDGSRRVRDQFLHSCEQVLRVLLTSVNVQRNNGPLSFLQVKRTSLMDIVEKTGFARSTVIAVIKILKKAEILKTERRKTKDKKAELVAIRWLTPKLFAMLGLGSWIKKQSKQGSTESQEQQTRENPGAERTRGDKSENSGRLAALKAAVAGASPPQPRTTTTTGDN